jgi:NADPH-dependent 2,4-dienoyl-CoA reductase/sulfur reductase-like enzyme
MTRSFAPRVTIVGASLAGLRTSEALVAAFPDARVTVVGDEPHAPYNRPPLSKEAAEALSAGEAPDQVFDRIRLRSRLNPDHVTVRLGVAARAWEGPGALRLEDGALLRSDWVVAATGLRPRRLSLPGAEDRRHVLRGFDDARRLAAALRPGASIVVIGAGFIGCEVASTARKRGARVTLVDPAPQPMGRALGARVAAALAAWHRSHGATLLMGRSVAAFEPGRVILDDGQALEADAVVEALGSVANTEWLEGCGADLSDGVLVDNRMIATGAEGLLAVGDVARFVNPLLDGTPRRIEHWCIPGQTAKRAAETIVALSAGREPDPLFAPPPSFWSDQYGLRIQAFGAPALGETQTVIEGDLARIGDGPVTVEYARGGKLIGLIGIGANPAALARHRARLFSALSPNLSARGPHE